MKKRIEWLWAKRIDELPLWKRGIAFFGRIAVASALRFENNDGSTRSAGLTYWTLMALVPVMAVLFAMAGALGMKAELEQTIRGAVAEYPEQAREFVENALAVVERVDITALSAIAILGLLYTTFAVMNRIEVAFNVTWETAKARNFARRYADYVAILVLVPLLVLASASLNTVLQWEALREDWPWIADALQQGLGLLPLLLGWIAISLLLKVVPNAQVHWIPALISGLFVSLAFYGTQWLFLKLQIGVTQANAIYGTLAFLPLFLIYLHISWSIVIVGAELCHTIQYRDVVLRPVHERRWTQERRRHLGLFLMREATLRFGKGGTLPLAETASRLDVPIDRVLEVAQNLERAGLLHFVRGRTALVPGRSPGEFTVGELFASLDHEGEVAETRSTSPKDLELLERARAALAQFDERI
jgi:membrane protein